MALADGSSNFAVVDSSIAPDFEDAASLVAESLVADSLAVDSLVAGSVVTGGGVSAAAVGTGGALPSLLALFSIVSWFDKI